MSKTVGVNHLLKGAHVSVNYCFVMHELKEPTVTNGVRSQKAGKIGKLKNGQRIKQQPGTTKV